MQNALRETLNQSAPDLAAPKLDVTAAFAAANLINLGFDVDSIRQLVDSWTQKQLRHSKLQALDFVNQITFALGAIEKLQPGHLYASFHFSAYQALYIALAQHDPQRRVLSLVGEQSVENQRILEVLGKSQGINISFVTSGYSMLRQLREGRAQGTSVLILIDVPWSADGAVKDAKYKFARGTILGLSAVERLVAKIDPDFKVVIPRMEDGRINIDSVPGNNFTDYLGHFGSLLLASPTDYERLDRLHRYCVFDRPRNALIAFSVGAQAQYILHTASMRTFELKIDSTLSNVLRSSIGVTRDPKALAVGSAVVGGDLEFILSL